MRTFTLFYNYCGEICAEEKVLFADLRKKIVPHEAGDHDRIEKWGRFATRGDHMRMRRVVILCESPKALSKTDAKAKNLCMAIDEQLSKRHLLNQIKQKRKGAAWRKATA